MIKSRIVGASMCALAVASNAAIASDETGVLRRCLQSKVAIEKGDFVGNNISLTVRNDLTWAVGGIRFAYQAFSDGREVPWIEQDVSLWISGGIEPGETRSIATSAFPPSEAPENLIVKAEVLDVADAQKRLLVQDVRVVNWNPEKSDRTCRPD